MRMSAQDYLFLFSLSYSNDPFLNMIALLTCDVYLEDRILKVIYNQKFKYNSLSVNPFCLFLEKINDLNYCLHDCLHEQLTQRCRYYFEKKMIGKRYSKL